MKCDDCGCKVYDGVCVNCHEELYIFETQNEFLPESVSDEFMEKVVEQQKARK